MRILSSYRSLSVPADEVGSPAAPVASTGGPAPRAVLDRPTESGLRVAAPACPVPPPPGNGAAGDSGAHAAAGGAPPLPTDSWVDAADRGDDVALSKLLDAIEASGTPPAVPLDARRAGKTALMRAAERGDAAVVRTLLAAGANYLEAVRAVDAYHSLQDAVFFATRPGHTEALAALADAGADLRGAYAALACCRPNGALLRLLREHGATDEALAPGMFHAAATDDVAGLADYLAVGVPLGLRLQPPIDCSAPCTALYHAARHGAAGAVRLLLQRGAANKAGAAQGSAPAAGPWWQPRRPQPWALAHGPSHILTVAAAAGSGAAIVDLIAHGAVPDQGHVDGAVLRGNAAAVAALLSHVAADAAQLRHWAEGATTMRLLQTALLLRNVAALRAHDEAARPRRGAPPPPAKGEDLQRGRLLRAVERSLATCGRLDREAPARIERIPDDTLPRPVSSPS